MKTVVDVSKQAASEANPSIVIGSPNPRLRRADILAAWTGEDLAAAVPTPLPIPSVGQPPAGADQVAQVAATTFPPRDINTSPYNAVCKVFYMNAGDAKCASGWIVEGDTGVKGILTAGHVLYDAGQWSSTFLVCRQYSGGVWAEAFTASNGRVLNGWLSGESPREFYDVAAIYPDSPIPEPTPSLAAIWSYNCTDPRVNFFCDAGYPAEPWHGYPFDGQFMWESDGPLADVAWANDRMLLAARNAMGPGSSGSPWIVYDPFSRTHRVAGLQSAGWSGQPASISPYFEQRNIVALLRDVGVLH